jgi:hypothetical protein
MTLKTFKEKLSEIQQIQFMTPNGKWIAPHFHITEIGKKTKTFLDCGNVLRSESFVTFQLWHANDFDHRLLPNKLLGIIENSAALNLDDSLSIEVEYQTDTTIGLFSLEFETDTFMLIAKETNCLAKDHCGITESEMPVSKNTCSSDSGCC